MADVGQEEVRFYTPYQYVLINNISKDFLAAEKKAMQVGAKKFFLEVSILSV